MGWFPMEERWKESWRRLNLVCCWWMILHLQDKRRFLLLIQMEKSKQKFLFKDSWVEICLRHKVRLRIRWILFIISLHLQDFLRLKGLFSNMFSIMGDSDDGEELKKSKSWFLEIIVFEGLRFQFGRVCDSFAWVAGRNACCRSCGETLWDRRSGIWTEIPNLKLLQHRRSEKWIEIPNLKSAVKFRDLETKAHLHSSSSSFH